MRPVRDPADSIVERLLEKASYRGVAAPTDPALERYCPYLWELCTKDQYADGTVRVLPSISITRVHGGFLVTIQDHASNLQCSAETVVLANAWVELERVLGSGKDVWRPYKSYKVRDPLKRSKGKGS